MNRMCDTGRTICPHKPQCIWHCHFTASELPEPNPLPVSSGGTTVNLDEIEPASDMWQIVASIAVGFVLFGVALFAAVAFVTGAWIWSLLI